MLALSDVISESVSRDSRSNCDDGRLSKIMAENGPNNVSDGAVSGYLRRI